MHLQYTVSVPPQTQSGKTKQEIKGIELQWEECEKLKAFLAWHVAFCRFYYMRLV